VNPCLTALFYLFAKDYRPAVSDKQERDLAPMGAGICGASPLLLKALGRAERLATSNLPVLILGESGTGKELVAKYIHQNSSRPEASFLPINCAALTPTLILSELFGHVRGAFTGADKDHQGFFEAARGGTVFLDEIGDLPASAQGMLLRTLQEGEVRRLGESFARQVDVRIVAATHRDLPEMVAAGSFRQDLYFRLKVVIVRLPSLRERGEDLLILAKHFLSKESDDLLCRLSQEAVSALRSHTWPGNVRELKNVLGVAAMLAGEEEIQPEHLDLPVGPTSGESDYHQQLSALRKKLIGEALQETGGNRAQAARTLGISRQTLTYMSGRYGFD
jgi:transcriptional regulator with PAS, ATPase and Fis domain